MKPSKPNFKKSEHKSSAMLMLKTTCLIAVIYCLSINHTLAQQVKWAFQYAQWNFDDAIPDVWNIDQQVWIAEPNTATFWPIQWSLVGGSGVGGYLGLQQQGNGSVNVRFSLWNATESAGESCRKFSGEGIWQTCELSINIDTTKILQIQNLAP
jgi:hypothetical protein